jgi:phytoene dehydrogenase-like protein
VPGVFGRAVVAETRRVEPPAESRRPDPDRPYGGDRRAPAPPPNLIRDLEQRCADLAKLNADLESRHAEMQAELARAALALDEAAKQRDLYQMSVTAAEERIRKLQLELEGPAEERGPDKRFNLLRRYLARELHPDLAGEDAAERVIRETIFKRVWAKIEQLQ